VSKDQALSSLDYWHLCDELTINEAAFLVLGRDPAENRNLSDLPPPGYEAVKKAISTAFRTHKIKGLLVRGWASQGDEFVDPTGDIGKSIVDVTSLREWLISRGMSSGFFFPPEPSQPGYLDRDHARYAPKLAAAVTAWQAFEGVLTLGRSPKQVLTEWLEEHAAEFGLSDKAGNPNKTGIEDVAKVANWQLVGGAPKTPG
jgi:hypothetical protein